MATQLAVTAVEESTYAVTAAFKDEDGTAITPQTILWTLTDKLGTVINLRENISVVPATSITIVLTGDDLATSTVGRTRVITILATYNSDYGTLLKLKGAATFDIENLVAVS
jgi:hypothetical protein